MPYSKGLRKDAVISTLNKRGGEGEGSLNLNTGKAELIYGILQMGHPGAEVGSVYKQPDTGYRMYLLAYPIAPVVHGW